MILRSKTLLLAALTLSCATVSRAGDPITPAETPKMGKEILVIRDSKDAQTFNAHGEDVTVNGSHNKVTIVGNCHALNVSGDSNGVTLDGVSSITVTGDGNAITWKQAVDGKNPEVSSTGKDNKVTRALQ